MKKIEMKKNSIEINLPLEDWKSLYETATMQGMTIPALFEAFAADLVDGSYSHGSDERMYAQEWLDRCMFDTSREYSFLNYLLQDCGDSVNDVATAYEAIESSKAAIARSETWLKNGFITGRNGEEYTWKDITISSREGIKPLYKNKEEWERAELEDIRAEHENINFYRRELGDLWKGYCSDHNHKDCIDQPAILEAEIKKVLTWKEERDRLLEPDQEPQSGEQQHEKKRSKEMER